MRGDIHYVREVGGLVTWDIREVWREGGWREFGVDAGCIDRFCFCSCSFIDYLTVYA